MMKLIAVLILPTHWQKTTTTTTRESLQEQTS